MRDRLIELILNTPYDSNACKLCAGDGSCEVCNAERIADHLLANGVIVPPCKIGDDIWWLSSENTVECQKNGISLVAWNGKQWLVGDDDGNVDPIGSEWCFLTKEDAEKALKERVQNE